MWDITTTDGVFFFAVSLSLSLFSASLALERMEEGTERGRKEEASAVAKLIKMSDGANGKSLRRGGEPWVG